MEISTDQYNRILNRLTKLETGFNDMATALDKCITRQQVTELVTLQESSIQALEEQVSALEDRVTSIEEEPIT